MAVHPGQKFDRYSIEELVGEGGMGRVYRAFDTRLERSVALKVLHAAGGDTAESIAIALREARAAAAIAHPNATAIYDAHEIEGTSFIAMEFVAGTSLRSLISGTPAPMPTRLRWLIDVAAALNAAHRTGVVHRDVKPENVMVRNDGLVKVLDFGVARRTVIDAPPGSSGEPMLHASGSRIAGTPAYMAPEQIRGADIDGRADQFSWGVLAYELLTGSLPWRSARDLVGYIAAIVTEDPLPPSALAPAVPPAVDAAVLRALSKNPTHRFPNMLAAGAELLPFARGSIAMAAVPVVPVAGDLDPATDPGANPIAAPPPQSRKAPEVPVVAAHPPLVASPPRPPLPSVPAVEAPRPGADARDAQPSSSGPTPAPLSSGTRVRISRGAAGRRRWPFGSGFHEPDFEAPVDLDAHLALAPVEATCKGLFLLDPLQQAARLMPELELLRVAQVKEKRFVAFRDYPLTDGLKVLFTAARVLYPRYSLGEGLRRLGQTAIDALLATHVGRSIFGVLGRDVEPILLNAPKAFKLVLSSCNMAAEKTAFRTFVFRASELPCFVETYQVGVLEGMVRHCGERTRVSIALDDLATATIELRLL